MRISNLFFKRLLNERGIGVVGVMIAAALVVVAAFTVASFVTDQWRQSMRLEISGSCQNIANSIVEYIKKDDNSLFISSFGSRNVGLPSSSVATQFPAGLATNDDGIDRFRFASSSPVSTFSGSGAPMTAAGTLNPAWSYNNHLNLRNSANRLIALAASGNYCCADLNMNDPNCGSEFYSNTMTRPGFTIADRNVDVVLAANIVNASGGSACTGRTLLTSNLPNSRNGLPIDFKVRVTINRDQDNQRICEASGRVQRNTDVDAPLTILQYDTNFCAWGGSTPSACTAGAGTPIQIRVKTVRNGSGTSCQSSCLGGISSQRCTDISPGELSLFNSHTHASCGTANCPESDPGSMFLCKIGEKQWAMTNNNLNDANVWQPCESATVKDYDGTAIPGATVEIRHDPVINDPTQSERTTEAIIILNGLIANRSYVVDVRAVDTAGNVGPGFCDYSSSCNDGVPHFTLVAAPPAPGPITDTSLHVMASSQPTQLGRDNTLPAIPRYSSIMGSFGGTYQCQNGSPLFQVSTSAVPTGAYPASGDDCVATYTNASGATSNPYCPCTSGSCSAVMTNPVNISGNHNIQMNLTNVCGSAPPVTLDWCLDNNNAIGVTANAPGTMSPSPNFSGHLNYPTTNPTGTKACGLLTLCPRVDGNFTPVMRTTTAATCGVPADWNVSAHSGCIASPTNNLCTLVVDACGRYENIGSAAASATSQYATYLATGGGTTNECYNYGGSAVSGNRCDLPDGGAPICSLGGKCAASCTKQGQVCSNDEECQDNSLGAAYNQANGPKCTGNRCTCGSNKFTPVVSNAGCGPQYCPELNSCNGVNIANTPNGGQSCTSCSHWNMGAWNACAEVSPGVFQESRSVTCSGVDCSCYPAPPSTRNCPSCGTANGGSFVTAPTSNLCSSGNASAVSGPPWSWTCTLDGRTAFCGASQPPPINATCGPSNGGSFATAPSSGLCDVGNAGAVTGSGPWNWTCTGIDGGTDANCSASVAAAPVNGVCGAANGGSHADAAAVNAAGLCNAGTAPAVSGAGPWNWTCVGANGGTNSPGCSALQAACAWGSVTTVNWAGSFGSVSPGERVIGFIVDNTPANAAYFTAPPFTISSAGQRMGSGTTGQVVPAGKRGYVHTCSGACTWLPQIRTLIQNHTCTAGDIQGEGDNLSIAGTPCLCP